MNRILTTVSALTILLIPSTSFAAKPDPESQDKKDVQVSETLPPPVSDDDPNPQVPKPVTPEGGLVEQAGVGGTTSYARAGVLELGGSLSFQKASDYTSLTIAPTIGWFFMDNVELSVLLGISHLSSAGNDTTFLSLLAEPSFHIPFTNTLFGFFGLGLGLSWAKEVGAGFAIAPRLGVNVMVGRSGVLTPAIYAQYSTHDAIQTNAGTLIAVSFGYGLNIGYTVMW